MKAILHLNENIRGNSVKDINGNVCQKGYYDIPTSE